MKSITKLKNYLSKSRLIRMMMTITARRNLLGLGLPQLLHQSPCFHRSLRLALPLHHDPHLPLARVNAACLRSNYKRSTTQSTQYSKIWQHSQMTLTSFGQIYRKRLEISSVRCSPKPQKKRSSTVNKPFSKI